MLQHGKIEKDKVHSTPHSNGKGNPNELDLIIVVNGMPTKVTANVHAPLKTVVTEALKQTENDSGRSAEGWVLKDKDGVTLDVSRKIEEFSFAAGTKLYLSPEVGAGG